ncbi:MAG: acyl-CoA dehydrogenase family protein [Chitinophagales bacterium]
MSLDLTTAQQSLKTEIIAFAEQHLNQGAAQRDELQEFDRTLWQKSGALRLPGLAVPESCGGRGLDVVSTMVGLEALGYGCRDNGFSFAIGAHLLACVVPIWLYGNEQQKTNLLPSLCDGTWIIANAMTESESGSDAFNMQTTAAKKGDCFVLNGEKNFCSNAPVADMLLTYAATDRAKGMFGGISAFILQKSLKQYELGGKVDKMGLRSCTMSSVFFDNVSLSKTDLLGKEGGGAVMFTKSMIWERIGLSAVHLGTLQRLLEDTIEVVKKRKKAIGTAYGEDFQAVSHQLASIKVELEAARHLVYHAAWLLQNKKSADLYSSMAKLKASELYKKDTMELLQIQESMAHSNDANMVRSFKDATASTIYSGSSEIQKNIIAKRLKI